MNTKKGQSEPILPYVLIIGVAVVLGTLIVATVSNAEVLDFRGETQLSLMNSVELNERTFTYLDAASGIALRRSIEDLGETGGFQPGNFEEERFIVPCGHVVYPLWNREGREDCLPDFAESIAAISEINFRNTLSNFPEVDIASTEFTFDVTLDDDEIKYDIVSQNAIELPIYSRVGDYYNRRSVSEGSERTVESTSGAEILSGYNSGSRFQEQIDTIVMHWTGGSSSQGALAALRSQGFSYHYIIDRDGTTYNLVPESRSAFHAGCAGRSSDTCERGFNSRSIGISFVSCGYNRSECVTSCREWDQGGIWPSRCYDEFTQSQYEVAGELVADLAGRHRGIQLDTNHIIGHDVIADVKDDPGPWFDYEYVIERAQQSIRTRRGLDE